MFRSRFDWICLMLVYFQIFAIKISTRKLFRRRRRNQSQLPQIQVDEICPLISALSEFCSTEFVQVGDQFDSWNTSLGAFFFSSFIAIGIPNDGGIKRHYFVVRSWAYLEPLYFCCKRRVPRDEKGGKNRHMVGRRLASTKGRDGAHPGLKQEYRRSWYWVARHSKTATTARNLLIAGSQNL